jgi:probable H4MPT-linked C1 transfer pathway protein
MKIAGFDIGGANTDLAVVEFGESGGIQDIQTDYRYLPMWLKKDELTDTLLDLLGREQGEIDAVGVCMTAELADAYQNKSEGVMDIVTRVMEAFNLPVGFVGLKGMMDYREVHQNPLELAAANWIATAPLASHISPNCIFIDTGSTTTDIIPIKNGRECARGRSDLERLATGELVYTGVLRTNIATLTDKVPLGQNWVRVASELFSVTADVHLVLGNITPEDYTSDTPDGAGKSREDCMRRIARVVCGDLDILSQEDVEGIASYVYEEQVKRVAEALQEVTIRENLDKVVVTGLGMEILGKKASAMVGLKVKSMNQIFSREECVVAPAVGTALLMEEFIKK